MNMTISQRDRDLLIGFAGILIAVAAWFFVASPMKEKTEIYRAENDALRPKVEEFQAVAARIDDYQEEMVNFVNERDEILSHYPSSIEKEDVLMFWSNIDRMDPDNLLAGDIELESFERVEIEGLNSGNTEVTYDEDGNVIEGAEEQGNSSYVLYRAPVVYEFASTYRGAKQALQYLYSQYDKNMISGFSLEYDDSTGLLYGNAAVNLFYLDGTDRAYEPSFIPSLPTGVDNIFHTIDGTVEERKQAGAPEQGEREGEEAGEQEDNE